MPNQNLDSQVKVQADETISFMLTRTGSKDIVMPNDEVNQTLTLTNQSDYVISNIYVQDTIEEGVKFKTGSLYINGTSYPNFNVTSGFTLPDVIMPSSSETITYKVIVDDAPQNVNMPIFSTVTFTAEDTEYTKQSSTYNLQLAVANFEIKKTSSKSAVKQGDTLTYQNVITNTGTLTGTKITFQDDIPQGTTFVEDSVKINGTNVPTLNPQTGFNLDNLYASQSITISFDVTVD